MLQIESKLLKGARYGGKIWRRHTLWPPVAICGFATCARVSSEGKIASSRDNVMDILEERGLIESVTGEKLRQACSDAKPLKVYCGFDPTAASLHLGNLLGIIVLAWFQRCGHVPVVLLGGATARVGDPSGKSTERPVLDEVTIQNNLSGIQAVLSNILKAHKFPSSSPFVEETEASSSKVFFSPVFVNNYEWWKEFSLLEFLRDVGKHARVGTMMAKENVKRRLASEEGISFTEFTYQLLQGYDFVYLYKNEGVSVQIGGSDQWGNITAGTDLIRRLLQEDSAYGLTFPLLVKSDGTKFGKSEGGAIWLSPSFLSPYKFYQHLFLTPDSDVIKFLKMLTFIGLPEINKIEEAMGSSEYVPNTAQKKLAEEVTRFVHGEEGLADALKATEALTPGADTPLDWQAIEAIAQDVPSSHLPLETVVGSALVDVCVTAGLFPSKGAVRRLIKQGGLYLNNEKVEDEGKILEAVDVIDAKMFLLSAGKKNKMVVRVEQYSQS
ncbi:hypothetical protein O6H91_07G077500 [Diphasiastrum complanatum]|nr:hypothetical protein O6H91_07G077500 [Diphasiastrum complanatum]